MKLLQNKKGAGEYALLGFLLFLIFMGMAFSETNLSDEEFVGRTQYKILQANERTQLAQQYVTAAASYSAEFAVMDLFKFAGIFQEQSDTGEALNPPCGTYQYSLYSNKEKNCTPDYKSSYSAFFQESMSTYLHNYQDTPLFFVYDLSFEEDFQNNHVRLLGESYNKLKMYVFATTPEEQDFSLLESELGGYGDEQTLPCATGKCVVDVANHFHSLYSTDGESFPYVWGGESPYPYEDTLVLAKEQDSFFYGVSMGEYQPEPHHTKLTTPGFDCSGWVWWVAKHAQISGFEQRLSANDYYTRAKSQAQEICSYNSNPCYSQTIFQKALPGDILFYGTPSKVTHIMIYAGDGFISHSAGSKGLIREKLRTSYASETSTKIVGTYRFPYNQDGYDSLNAYLEEVDPDVSNITIETNETTNQTNATTQPTTPQTSQVELLGPVDWCDGTEKLPKGTYANRINEEAWNSEGKTYYDIAVEAGLEEGVDPALITTHMIYETSMGKHDSCTEKGHSSLTGCTWTGTCVKECDCGGVSTASDKNQLACTARTDQGAYVEAVTGEDKVVGEYQNCNEYKDDSEKFWTCILCIYQGDYDSIVPGSTGKTYFTRDGTCKYAENFKNTYCSWRQFYDEKGYEASSASKPGGPISKSYIQYTPYIDTELTMNFADLEYVKDFVEETQQDCKDNLKTCVQEKINLFNTNNPRVQLTINNEENALARDVADQLLDCHLNEQERCICPVSINLSLNSSGKDEFSIYMDETKYMYVGDEGGVTGFSKKDSKKITKLPFYPTSVFTTERDGHDYVELLIDKTDAANNEFEAEDTNIEIAGLEIGDDYTWNLGLENGADADIALKKTDQVEYDWMQYQKEKRDPWKECRANKNYFRLQAGFEFTNDTLDFSLYLEDKHAPEILLQQLDQSGCSGQPTIQLSWIIPKNSDPTYDFLIKYQGEEKVFQTLEATAQEASSTTDSALYQLYKQERTSDILYYYLIKETPEGTSFEINQTYTFSVLARDHYLNSKESYLSQIKIVESQEEQVLNEVGLGALGSTLETIQQLTPLGICADSYHRIAVLDENNTILSWEAKGPLGTNQVITFDGPNSTINITNLEIYEGVVNPQTGEQLYWIKDIPNIICNEADTSVGKICAANPQLVTQLHRLSAERLVPENRMMYITQAFRTHDIQEKLWILNDRNNSKACNPNIKICPHMIAGAIDLRIQENGINIPDAEQERVMCDYGFVRYWREAWHFEYGTYRWEAAEEKRSLGQDVCRY